MNNRHRIRKQFRRQFQTPKRRQPTTPEAKALAGLNCLSVLADKAPLYLQDALHYGPAVFVGAGWAATLIWYRDKGYANYKHLMLFGVWAMHRTDQIQLAIGTKPLAFSAAIYNPESYHAIIPQGFSTHYGDDGSPPEDEHIIKWVKYDAAQRLSLRRMLATEIEAALRYLAH